MLKFQNLESKTSVNFGAASKAQWKDFEKVDYYP